MQIRIQWAENEDVAQTIGTIMCEIPHKEGMPISCETVSTGKNGKGIETMLTIISNEGDKL